MNLPAIPQIELYGVLDRGVPNKECVVIRVLETINLGDIGLLAGLSVDSGRALPLPNYFLWLDNEIMEAPCWLFIFTGQGVPRTTTETQTGQPARIIYWGCERTVFHIPGSIPVLVRFGQLLIGPQVIRSVNDPAFVNNGQQQKYLADLFGPSDDNPVDWVALLGGKPPSGLL